MTLTSQKSPLRVGLSLSHTHIGLPQGFNFPTSIPFTFIWESSLVLATTSAYKLGRFWRPPRSWRRWPRKGSPTYKIVKSFLISLSLVPLSGVVTKISSCRVNTTSRGAGGGGESKREGFLLGIFLFFFPLKVAGAHVHSSRRKSPTPAS